MPLIKIKKQADYIYGIWEIRESITSLSKNVNFNQTEKDYLHKISNTKRKKQSVAAKLILNHLTAKKINISYTSHGAPFCENHQNISISHSNKLSIALISKDLIGIDIQLKSAKINVIKSKFVNKNDSNNFFESEDFLHHAWCAKEAIYKTLNGLPCSFKKNIFIKNLNESNSLGLYKKDDRIINFKIYHEIFKNYFISIAKKIND